MQKRNPVYVGIYPFALAADAMLWPFFKLLLRDEFSTVTLGRLSFYGNSRLHDLAVPTMERIKGIDPEIHRRILDTPLILTMEWKGEKRKESIPVRSAARGRFCIFNWMIDEGIDSVVFGIFDYYHRFTTRASTPLVSSILEPDSWRSKSMIQTRDWLIRHEFNPQTIEYLEKTWYKKN